MNKAKAKKIIADECLNIRVEKLEYAGLWGIEIDNLFNTKKEAIYFLKAIDTLLTSK